MIVSFITSAVAAPLALVLTWVLAGGTAIFAITYGARQTPEVRRFIVDVLRAIRSGKGD